MVAVLWDSATGRDQRNAIESAAAELNLTLTVLEVRLANDLERAMQTGKNQGAGGLILLSSPLVAGNTKLLADLAMKYHLPAITLFAEFARDGGLMSYKPSCGRKVSWRLRYCWELILRRCRSKHQLDLNSY